MASKIIINLDTSKENYLVAKCKQNDDLTLEASIFENGEALSLTNKVVTIQALKANNTYIIQNTNITKSNNKITVNLDRDFSRVPGTTKIEIVLIEGGKNNTTFSFYLEVVGSVIKGAVQSSNTVTILEDLEKKIVEAGVVKEETEQLIAEGGAATKGDVAEINASLEHIEQQKANKNSIFTMANMGQDIKTAMTGGSVAIVGENAINTINYIDGSLSPQKLDKPTSDLLGIEKLDLIWVVGELQNGNINSLSKIRAITENFVTLDEDVNLYLKDKVNFKLIVARYTLSGIYTGVLNVYNDDIVIPKTDNQKIRIQVGYTDNRLISSVYPLTQQIAIVKEKNISLKKIDSRIKVLETKTSFPSYWESHIATKINTIKQLQKNVGYNGTSFGFITDIHYNNNSKNSAYLLEKVMKDCDIPYYFDGGDFCANPSNVPKATQIEEIQAYKKTFKPLEESCLRAIGNHDDNSINNKFSMTITDKEMYDLLYRQNSKYQKIKSGKTGEYYYIDDEMHKIRYVVLNAIDIPYVQTDNDGLKYKGMGTWVFRQEQCDWFTKEALNVPSQNWGVVVCSHIPINHGLVKNDHILMNSLQAFNDKTSYSASSYSNVEEDLKVTVNVDYAGKGGVAICWISGHVHVDKFINLPSNITFKALTTINDSLHVETGQPTKSIATATENAFDIFTINKETRTVNITRIGAGEDRSFMY